MTYDYFCTLPVRPVRMRILRGVDETDLKQTIVPATAIYLRKGGAIDLNTIDRDAITYSVANTRKPFPFGHIYRASGHVCLGSIFVPSRISRYNPQQPLETLFLHNDRNLSHGGARLTLKKEQINEIYEILEAHYIYSAAIGINLEPGENLLQYDQIWVLGAEVYARTGLENALKIMTSIYEVIFTKTSKREEVK